ncbi:MAG: hypothetical protein RR506_07970 [Akkermansia sp.]
MKTNKNRHQGGLMIPQNVTMVGDPAVNNTISTQLQTQSVSAALIDAIESELAPLAVFSQNFSQDFVNTGATVNVELVESMGSVLKDTTEWNKSSMKLGVKSVHLTRYSMPFGLTEAQRRNGTQLRNKVSAAAKVLARGIWSDLIAAMKAGAPGTANIGPSSKFEASMATRNIWPLVGGDPKALVLGREYYASLIPTNALSLELTSGAYGFGGGVYYAEGVSGLVDTNKGAGFVATPSAMAIAAALPVIDTELNIATEVLELPTLGLSFLLKRWGDANTETVFYSPEIMFGATLGDIKKLKLLSIDAPVTTPGV